MERLFNNKPALFLLLSIAVFLAFGNALSNQFVWDDGYLIVQNPHIKDFKFFPGLFKGDLMDSAANPFADSNYYRPLSMFSFMVDYRLWKLNPFGYHLTNILIHLLNTCLVFLIVFRIFRKNPIAFFAAVLFAAYPLHVEAVTPVYNRMGIQGSLFVLGSLYLFMRSEDLRRGAVLAAALGLFSLGLLSKEDTIVLPLLFLAYDYFYFSAGKLKNLFEKRKLIFYFFCALFCSVYFFIRHLNIEGPPKMGTALAGNFFFHLLTVAAIFGGYILKMIFPWNLQAVYWIDPVASLSEARVLAGLILFFALIALFFRFCKRSSNASFLLAFFLISVLPFTNIIPLGASYTFHERFLYLPSVALCIFLGALTDKGISGGRGRAFIAGTIFFGLLVSFLAASRIANDSWRDNLSLWKTAVKKSPVDFLAHLNLGDAYLNAGRYNEALYEFETALSDPRMKGVSQDGVYLARINLVKIYTETGNYPKAQEELGEAMSLSREIGINPFAVHDKAGLLFARLGDADKAEKSFLEAIKNDEKFTPAYYNLGVLYFERKDYTKAEEQFTRALNLDPDFSQAAVALGLTYIQRQKPDLAEVMFEKALKVNPGDQAARQYLLLLRKAKQ